MVKGQAIGSWRPGGCVLTQRGEEGRNKAKLDLDAFAFIAPLLFFPPWPLLFSYCLFLLIFTLPFSHPRPLFLPLLCMCRTLFYLLYI